MSGLTLLQRQAEQWERAGRPDTLLLRGAALAEQERSIESRLAELTPVEWAFLLASQQKREGEQSELIAVRQMANEAASKVERERLKNQRLKVWLFLAGGVALIAIVAAILVFSAGSLAPNPEYAEQAQAAALVEQTRAAQAQLTATAALDAAASANQAALEQQSTLAALLAEAAAAQKIADAGATQAAGEFLAVQTESAAAARAQSAAATAQAEALSAQQAAESAQTLAGEQLEQARIAFSSQLALASLATLEQKSDLAPLLAAEAYCSADTATARSALLTLLQANMQYQLEYLPPELNAFSPVRSVVYSPAGSWIAWGAEDSPVTWRDNRSGLSYQDPGELRPRAVAALAFSPDERWLVSGSLDGTLVLRDLPSGESRQAARMPAPIHSLAIDRQNRLAAAVGDAVWLWPLDALWKTAETGVGQPLIQQPREILSLAWDPAGGRLATGSQDGSLRIFRPGEDAIVLMEKAHTRAVRSVAWSPDGSRLASAGDDGSLVLWDPLTGLPDGLPLSEKLPRPLYGVSFSPDGRLLAAGGANNVLTIWDVASRQEVASVRDRFRDDLIGLAFSPIKLVGTDRLVVGSASGQVVLFSVVTGQTLVEQPYPALETGVSMIALSNLAGGTVTGLAQGVEGGSVLAAAPGDQAWQVLAPAYERVTAAAFSPDARALALAQPVEDGRVEVQLVDTSDWEETGRLEFPLAGEQTSSLFGLAFDVTGTRLAASQCVQKSSTNPECTPNQNHLQFKSTTAQDDRLQDVNVGESQVRILAYDPRGRYLASSGAPAGVQIWQLSENGQALKSQAPIKDIYVDRRATALAFSLDGRLLAVGQEDSTLELWDTTTWQQIGFPLAGPAAPITALAFDSSGAWLVAASLDGTLQRWSVDPHAWATAACALTERKMTDQEWGLYFGSAAFNPACQRLAECKGK